MKNRILVTLTLFLFACAGLWADNTYPTPQRLFHIARSVNRNLVCYDVNLEKGNLNPRKPLKVYWINREEHPGKRGELSYIQRKMAYGYKVVSSRPGLSICTLTAYPKRQLVITRWKSGYACLVTINKQKALLRSLYVKAHPRNPLKVEYVELRGVSVATGRPVTERVRK